MPKNPNKKNISGKKGKHIPYLKKIKLIKNKLLQFKEKSG